MIKVTELKIERGSFLFMINNLAINKGEKIAVIGENGSGKSTLLHLLTGIIPSLGIEYFGKDINKIKRNERASLLAFMPQMPSVVFPLSVFEVVRLGAYAAGHRKNADKLTEEILKTTFLEPLRDRSFSELSGGEKRRVMIARSMNQRTELLVLDEPVSMLDVRYSLEIVNLLKESNQTVIASIHDVNLAVNYFDRVLMMKKGKLLYDVSAKSVETFMIMEVYGVKADFVAGNFSFSI